MIFIAKFDYQRVCLYGYMMIYVMISDFYPVSHSQMGASTLYRAPQLEHPAGSSS